MGEGLNRTKAKFRFQVGDLGHLLHCTFACLSVFLPERSYTSRVIVRITLTEGAFPGGTSGKEPA